MAQGTKEPGENLVSIVTRVPPKVFDRINNLSKEYKLSYAAMVRAILARGLETYKK